jgi:hypothetical protein
MKRWLVPTILLLAVTSVFGQDEERVSIQTRIEKQSATVTGDRGLFTVSSVETLNKGQFGVTAGWNNIDRTPKDLDINTYPVSFSIGILPGLMFTTTYEVQRQILAANLIQPGYYSEFPYVSKRFAKGPGDMYLGGKYRLWRQRDNVGGFAVRGYVKLGLAKPENGLGTGRTDGGADLIFTSSLPWKLHEVMMHSSIGYLATRNGKNPVPLMLKDEVRSGVGVAFPSTRTLQGIVEYVTTTFVGAGSPNDASIVVQDPSDVAAGVRYLDLDRGLTFNAGYRINTKFDRLFPNNGDRNGMVFGVSYTRPIAAIRNNHYPVIVLEADSAEIAPGGSAVITATGFDADNDPLTYSWTTTDGHIEGSGNRVSFSATGVTSGRVTIRATASDGRGGTATSQIDITVRR